MNVRQEIDRLLDTLPEEYLIGFYNEAQRIKKTYDFYQMLESKKIIYDYPYELGEHKPLIEKWEQTFTPITDEQKAVCLYDQYLWHTFSYEMLPCLSGENARIAFNNVMKRDVYFFYQHTINSESYSLEVFRNAKLLEAEDVAHKQDIYLFDDTYTWTYIQTHEECCGPYFIQLSGK